MLESLTFEICKKNNRSRFIRLTTDSSHLYLELAYGLQGIYMDDCITNYRCPLSEGERLFSRIEELKINTWPKAIPADYVPGKTIMGCNPHSWSITYKEQGKRTRHIHGKGDFPGLEFPTFTIGEPYVQPPWEEKRYSKFIDLMDMICPSRDLYDWLEED